MSIKFNPLIFGGFDLTGGGAAGAPQWKTPVPDEASLPMSGNSAGDARVVLDTDKIYIWDDATSKWIDTELTTLEVGSSPNLEGITLSTFDENVSGVDITRPAINLEPADESNPGVITTSTQTFAGTKTFLNDVVVEGSVDVYTTIESSSGNLELGNSTADINIGSAGSTSNIIIGDSSTTVQISYNPADPADWNPVPSYLIDGVDQLADRTYTLESNAVVQKEPTGFPNRTDSSISFSDSSPDRTFTISPTGGSFDFYVKSKKFTKSAPDSISLPNLSGNHYIYYDDAGFLQSTQVFTAALVQDNAIVSDVYWNPDTNLHTYFAEERHGVVMDGATHAYLHTVFGARYLSGLALQGFTMGSGNTNADAQFTSDQGTIRDEDIIHQLPALSQIPILYRIGQNWRKKAADAYPLIYSGTAGYVGANGRIPYNQYTGGAWQLTQVANSGFVLVHFFGTNDIENGVVGVQGIQTYNSVSAARIGANVEISSLSGLPFAEFVPIGSVIFKTANSFSNAVKAMVLPTDTGADYVDFRGTQLYTPAGEATTHGLLSGLANDDHFQYLLVSGTRAMSGALDMGTHQINNVVDGVASDDAATVGQLTDAITDSPGTFAGFDFTTGVLSPVPGWVFDNNGSAQIGAQNSLIIPAGTTDFTTLTLTPTVLSSGLANFSQININPQIDQPVNNYTAVQSYGYGTSAPNNYNGFLSQPQFTGMVDNLTHFNIAGNPTANNLTGINYTPTSDSGFEIVMNISPSGDTTDFKGVMITPSGDSDLFNGVIVAPSGSGAIFKGLNIYGTSTYDDVTGIEINLSNITSTSRKKGITVEDGVIQQNNTSLTTISSLPTLVDSANLFRNVFTVEASAPISGTDIILNNMSCELVIDDNYSPSPLNLGINSAGFVGQVSVEAGKQADIVSMSTAGFAVPATSNGGLIGQAHMYRTTGPLDFGGALTINEMYGLRIEDGLSNFTSGATWGVSVEDANAENYLAKSLVIGGIDKTTTSDEMALEIADAKTIKVGYVTTAERTALTNIAGSIVYDTDLNRFFGNDGSQWIQLNLSLGDLDRGSPLSLTPAGAPTDITGFSFSSLNVKGFEAIVSVSRTSPTDLYAEYTLKGIYKGSSWEMSQDYIGDDTGIVFNITTAGQIQYTLTAGNSADFTFRASTV